MAIAWQGGTHGARPILCAVVTVDFGATPKKSLVATFTDLLLVDNMIALCYQVGDAGATDTDQFFIRAYVTVGSVRVVVSSILPVSGTRLIGIHAMVL